jgi:hypothetical protein
MYLKVLSKKELLAWSEDVLGEIRREEGEEAVAEDAHVIGILSAFECAFELKKNIYVRKTLLVGKSLLGDIETKLKAYVFIGGLRCREQVGVKASQSADEAQHDERIQSDRQRQRRIREAWKTPLVSFILCFFFPIINSSDLLKKHYRERTCPIHLRCLRSLL